MSDNYVAKLENLLKILQNVIQTVPEAKKLLDSVGINTKDLEPTVKDSKTGEVIGQKTERQAQLRVEDVEEAIASNERLNQIIKERIALMQQEANAAKQVKSVTGTSSTPSGSPSSAPSGSRRRQSPQLEVPGDFSVIVPERKDKAPSAKRSFVLPEEADVASLTNSELAQVKLAVRAIAKKMTASGSPRGRGLLDSIKPGRSSGSVVNAFEEALSSVAMESDNTFVEFGTNATTKLGDMANFRRSLPTLTQVIRQATRGPVLRPNKLTAGGEEAAGSRNVKYVLSSSAGSDDDSGGGDGEAFRVNTDQRATGQSRRRAIHNTFGRVRDSIRHALGVPVGKGNNEDLRIQHDRNAGNIEAAGSADMLQEGVDESLKTTMRQVISASIDDVRAGRVSSPSSGRGGIASPAIPETLKAVLVKYAPQIEALSKDTTARGAIGKEGGGIGALGAPDAQHTLVGLFSAIVAAKISNPSVGKTREAQEAALRGIDVEEVFGNLFSPDPVTGREQATTTVAGIMHRRVLEDLQKRAKDAEESYIAESDGELKKEKLARLRMAQNELKTYEKLDEKPTVVKVDPSTPPEKRATDATMAMKYRMPQSQLREDLKAKYLTGTTTAQLVEEGVRTATTRSGGGYKPGQIVEMPEVPGKRFEVTSVEKPDFSTPEGIAAWESKEGWSFKDLPESLRRQVTNPKARQVSFKPYEESKSATTALSTDVRTVPPIIPVPADMIANPTATVTGVDNNPEEMIQRVAGGRFDQGNKFTDFITDVRAHAARVVPYLTRIGRADLPVPFDAPTPLRRIVENAAEGIALDDELPSQKQQEELASINSKQTDNVLAELGLIGSNSKYQNFYSGLNTAATITNKDGTINDSAVRSLSNPRGKIKSFFSSIQQLEQAEYNGFPILDYARANNPDELNTELIEQMEKASPTLKNLPKSLLGQIRNISESPEFQKSDSFSQFAKLTDLIRPVLEPLLGGGKRGKDIADVLVAAPAQARANLPLLHTPGTMSDKLAEVLGNTGELDEARKPESDWRSPVQMAKGLRYRIQALAKSITGRFPSPAFNDLRVQAHKRAGIVAYDKKNENLEITDKLAEDQYLASLRPEERATLIGDQEEENYSAGENARIEEERDRVNRILKDPQSADEVKERGIILARIAAGQEPLGPEFAERDQLTDDIVYDHEGNRAYTKRPSYIDKPSEKSRLDEIVANFHKEQAGNNGLKQLLATAIGSPTARDSIIKSFETMSPGMAGSLRFTDFSEQSSVDDFIRDNSKTAESREQAKQLAALMKRERGTKYLKDPAIAGLLSRAEQESPTKIMVAERQARSKEEKEQAGDIGRKVGKLRVISNLRNFGFPSEENLSSPVDSTELKKMQNILSVLSPEDTEEFRKIDASDPAQIDKLNKDRDSERQKKEERFDALYRHAGETRQLGTKLRSRFFEQGIENPEEHERSSPLAIRAHRMLESKQQRELDAIGTPGMSILDRARRTAFGLSERLYKMQEGFKTTPSEDIKRLEKQIPEGASVYMGSHVENAQLLAKEQRESVSYAIEGGIHMDAKERMDERIDTLSPDEEMQYEIAMKDYEEKAAKRRILQSKYAERQDRRREEVNAMIDASVERRGRPVSVEARHRILRSMALPDIKFFSNLKKPRRPGEALSRDERQALYEESPEKQEAEAAIAAHRASTEAMLTPTINYSFNRVSAKGLPETAAALKEIPEVDAVVKAQYGQEEIPYESRYGSAFGGAGIQTDSRAYRELTGGSDARREALLAEAEPEDEVEEDRKALAALYQQEMRNRAEMAEDARQRAKSATGAKKHSDAKDNEGLTDEEIDRKYGESSSTWVSRTESRRIAAEEKRAAEQKRIAEERIAAEEIAVKKAAEEDDRVSGRRALPAPDPSKPEEEYTKTAEQLAAEEPARKAAEDARRRSEAAQRGLATRRRNIRRKRIESTYTNYDAGAVVPPSIPGGVALGGPILVRALPAPDPSRPEEEYTKTHSQLAAEKAVQDEAERQRRRARRRPIAARAFALYRDYQAGRGSRPRRTFALPDRQADAQRREEEYESRLVPIQQRIDDRENGRFLLPAPDPERPEEEYTKTESQLAAEKAVQDEAERQRLRERKRRVSARANSIFREYNAGRGARPRRQFNLRGPVPDTDPLRRPLSYVGQDRPQSRFQLFRQRASAGYRRLTNEGVDVGQMPLVADSAREQPATIAEERELRRQRTEENSQLARQRAAEKRGADREDETESRIASIRGSEREDNLDSALRPIQNENAKRQTIRVAEEKFKELEKKEGDAWLESERIKKAEKDKIQQDRLNRRKAKSIESKRRQPQTAAKVAAREEKQYMSEPAVARRTGVAEERRDKREQEAESEIRSIREVTRRREDAAIREEEYEGRLKYIKRLNFDSRLPRQGASYQVPTYERQQSVDNPEYEAAIEQAEEKVNRGVVGKYTTGNFLGIAGLTESQKASHMQRLRGRITVPEKIKPAGIVSRLFRRFTRELADIKNEVTNEGVDISALPLFPDVGTGKNVLVRDTPRIARKRNEAAERLADRSETDAKIAAREAGPRAARREKLEAERAEKKRVIDEERLNRRKAKSIESKKRQPQTNAKVAAREKRQYFSTSAALRRSLAGEGYDPGSRPSTMENPELAKRRAEIDQKVAEREKRLDAKTAERTDYTDKELAELNPEFKRMYDGAIQHMSMPTTGVGGDPLRPEDRAVLKQAEKELRKKLKAEGRSGLDKEERHAWYTEQLEKLPSFNEAVQKRFNLWHKEGYKNSRETAINEISTGAGGSKKPRSIRPGFAERAKRMLSREENPEYAQAVKTVKAWMKRVKITDPTEQAEYLAKINVPRYRDMAATVEKPNAYRVDSQKRRDYINLAELRNYSPVDDPGAGARMTSQVVESAIQRKLFSDMGPMTADETASREARAQKIRDRLVKNKRPYNEDWRRAERRDAIEKIMTFPEEILTEGQKNAKADLMARAAKGEDIYELDPAKSGKGGKGGKGGGGAGSGGGGDDPPEDGDAGAGGKGKGRGRGGKGEGASVTAESIGVINAKTVIANGAPVNIIAKTVMTGGTPKGGAGASSGTGAASGTAPAAGAIGAAPVVGGTVTAPGAAPSGPIMPGSSTARFVRMGAFGPVFSTAPAAGATGASTTTTGAATTGVAGAPGVIGGSAMTGLFGSLFGGGGGGGGGAAGAFGLGGEFGEAGSRTFGADRLMSVQRLKAMRNSYEQNMGSLGGGSLGQSRSELVQVAQSTMQDIVDNEGTMQSLVTSATDAGLGAEAADVQSAFDEISDPSKNIADLAAALLKLQNALAALGIAAKTTSEDSTKTAEEIEAAKQTTGLVTKTSLQTNFAVEEQGKTQQDLEREANRRLGNLREGLQTNITRDSLFGFSVDQTRTRRRLLREYADETTGGNADALYKNGRIMAYREAGSFAGIKYGERRIDIKDATAKDLQYTQKKLAQDQNSNMTVQELTTLRKTINEEQAAKNQSSLASKFSHFTQKAQQMNYWATAAFNAPTDVMNMIDQAVRPALNAEKTMITARTLALKPETYGNALQAAQTQQKMFGGTLTKNVGAVTGFIPLANAYGVDINKTFNVARKLAAFDPAQGTEGAQIAIREYLSGNMSSLSRRFEISRSALSNIKQGDATEMIDSLDSLLAGMGITDRLIDDQAASMATKYDKMLGRLEAVQLNFSKIAVNALAPILESFAGEDSWMAAKTRADTTGSVLNERVAKVGDDVLSNSKNGSKTIKDLDVNSADFMENLDGMLSNANDAMIKENKLIEDSTGVDVNAKLFKRVHSMTNDERMQYMNQIKLKMMTGMSSESAIRQTMNEQTDFSGTEQFVTSRRKLGALGLTEKDITKRFDDANLAVIGKTGQKLTVEDLTVLDGDTFSFMLPGATEVTKGRLVGLDAPEKSIKESSMVKDYVESIVSNPDRYKVDVIGGYGIDNAEYNRQKVRAEVTDLETGEKFDLGNKLLSMGYAQFDTFGKKASDLEKGIYAAYMPVAEAVSDAGKGPVNSIASRSGYGAIVVPSQAAIDADYANQYGVGGSTAAGLAPWATGGGIIGGIAGNLVVPGVGTLPGVAIGTAIATGLGQWFNSSTYDADTSVDKVQRQTAEETKIQNRASLELAMQGKVGNRQMKTAQTQYNMGIQSAVSAGKITQEQANTQMLTDDKLVQLTELLTKDPKAPGGLGIPIAAFERFRKAFGSTGKIASELATEFETNRNAIESNVMQQVSTMSPEYQKVLDVQVDSTLRPGQKTTFLQESIDALALDQSSRTAEEKDLEGAGALASPAILESASKSADLLTAFISPEAQERFSAVLRAGELLQIPTGKMVTTFDKTTGGTIEVPETRAVIATPERTAQAIKEKDTSYFRAAEKAYEKVEKVGKSTYFEEAKKNSDALLDEQTKIREGLLTTLTSNAAMLSLTGLGQVNAEMVDRSRLNASQTAFGPDTGTAGQADTAGLSYTDSEKALSFIAGTEIDPSKSQNADAVGAMDTTLKQNLSKIRQSAQAFDQIAATTYLFDVQFKGTFRNFIDSMKAAGDNAETIMSNMGQGNPRFGMDYLTQMTGIDTKQFAMQYQMIPGMDNKRQSGASTSYGYTQGPMGTMKFVEDFFNNGQFASQFNLGESMQMINSAAVANTQMVQRNMQHNWQMSDLARDNARSIEDINRNGMLSLQSIHRGYVQQMLVLASQAEVDKRLSEVSTQEAINTADLPADVRNSIDVEDKIGRARAQHLGQFDIEGYLATGVGAQDTEMKGLFDQFKAMGPENSPEAEKFFTEVIRPAAEKRKAAALARSKDESLSPEERKAAETEYISLNNNPELALRATGIVDNTTKDRLRRASLIRQNEKNLVNLQLQREGLLATGARLTEQSNKAGPEEQASIGLQIKQNEQSLIDNADAMELASRTIGTLRAQDAAWNTTFEEQWKQLKTGIGTSTAGVILSIEELSRNMDTQLTEAYRKFGLAKEDMVLAFTRAATEIALQVPSKFITMYEAISAYQATSAAADILYNNGINVYAGGPGAGTTPELIGGPKAARDLKLAGARAAADVLYPDKNDPARASFLKTISAAATNQYRAADPNRDKTKDGLPVGFDLLTETHARGQSIRVIVVNGNELGLEVKPELKGDKNGDGIVDFRDLLVP